MSESIEHLTPLQRAGLALKRMRARLDALERQRSQPIAVVGMGCRFPGGVDDPQSFWRLLQEGTDAVTGVPPDRWSDDVFDSDPDAPGKAYTQSGGFLPRVDGFDAEFFGIAPREAAALDPQQRLLLEVVWEALEQAAIAPSSLRGSRSGVFVGIGQQDYFRILLQAAGLQVDSYDGVGNLFCFAAGRLSYFLGLEGPCFAIDTACSSSLVAIHQACQSLRAGECDMAIAAGVQLILAPEFNIMLSRSKALSADGRCRAFDAAASGFGRGEGCAAIVLKRLADAQAQRDRVAALITGSAINHDGAAAGLTVPSIPAQQALLEQACRSARIEPSQVDYVEAHGTGTVLGDPVEMTALSKVYGSRSKPLWVGTAKTNIGHLEAAAGIAGLIKVALSFQNEAIPPSLHFNNPNPRIPWDSIPIRVASQTVGWPRGEDPRIAGVSSFGLSGTNAHVILQEAPLPSEPSQEVEAEARTPVERPLHILTLSAESPSALEQLAERYRRRLAARPDVAAPDVCYTANRGRSHFSHRLALTGGSAAELKEKLARLVGNKDPDSPGIQSCQRVATQPGIAFLFTGQGCQYRGMTAELYRSQPDFRLAMEQCQEILRPLLPRPLLEVMHSSDEDDRSLDQTAYTQPAIFAVQYALARLWQSWGVHPSAVIGHSIGEYAAACIAGVFSPEAALKMVARRGILMQERCRPGAMAALLSGEDAVVQLLRHEGFPSVAIAAVNGPREVVISGDSAELQEVLKRFKEKGGHGVPLEVSHAFHSPLMEPMLPEFQQLADGVNFSPPNVPFISCLSGQLASTGLTESGYWVRHVSQPVRMKDGLDCLAGLELPIYLEIGPKPILLAMARKCAAKALCLPSLRPSVGDWARLLESLGEIYVRGGEIDWEGFDRGYARNRVDLPTYPFQRKRFWVDMAKPDAKVPGRGQPPLLDLLGKGNGWQQFGEMAAQSAGTAPDQKLTFAEWTQVVDSLQRQALSRSEVERHLYELRWEKARPLPQVGDQPALQGTWWIMADGQGLGESLARQIRDRGGDCRLIRMGRQWERGSGGGLVMDPAQPEHWARLAEEFKAASDGWCGIVHCWSLGAPEPEELNAENLQESASSGVLSLLGLVQALVGDDLPASTRLWAVTRGAVPVGQQEGSLQLAQAPLWGLGRVIAMEHPELWAGLIDLDPHASPQEARQLADLLLAPSGEDQTALRRGERYVTRLVRSAGLPVRSLEMDPDACYLIVGGLGGIGLRLARLLAGQGARHLVLSSLSGQVRPGGEEVLNEVRRLAEEVRIVQADVADGGRMRRLFDEIHASLPPLRGIVHCAGISGYEELRNISPESFEQTLRPKVSGAWLLHQLSAGLDLDFFVNFSSTSSVWGSLGLGHYTAASHFLDMLAHYRRRTGLAGLSINWGPWSEGGMTSGKAQGWLRRMGVRPLQPDFALEAFRQLLSSDAAQAVVADIDWCTFKKFYQARAKRPLLEHIETQREKRVRSTSALSDWAERIRRAPSDERFDMLTALVAQELAHVLRVEDPRSMPPEKGFFQMGMDSLTAVELKDRIEACLGLELPATLAFDYSSILQLARHLSDCLADEASSSPQPSDRGAEAQPEWLHELSEEEAEKLLEKKLEVL